MEDRRICPADKLAEHEICEVKYIQRPWISKQKFIISNNCTTSQHFSSIEPVGEQNHEIESNNLASNGETVMDDNRLADLESQIEVDHPVEKPTSFDNAIPQVQSDKAVNTEGRLYIKYLCF